MKLSSFLVIKAIVCAIFGIGFVFLPRALMSIYGATLDTTGVFMSQLFGAVFIGIGLICWLYKNMDSNILKGITYALCITDSIGFIIALFNQLSGNFNAFGWINVALWFLFALGLSYFSFLKPSTK
jgi:hypothetical protein